LTAFFFVKTCQKRRVFLYKQLTKAFWALYICGNKKVAKQQPCRKIAIAPYSKEFYK
jgi:hypothetical protein